MSAKMKNYLIIALIAAVVVYASNNVDVVENYLG